MVAEKKKPGILAVIAVWVVFAAALYGCLFTGEPRVKTADELRAEKVLMAYIRCENATESRIADPDGLRVAAHSTWTSEWSDDLNVVQFSYEVVARNAFGALVPGQFQCEAEYDGERWSVTDVRQQ